MILQIKEVIERFLDDDQDMHRLNLTALELSRQASEAEELAVGGGWGPKGGWGRVFLCVGVLWGWIGQVCLACVEHTVSVV